METTELEGAGSLRSRESEEESLSTEVSMPMSTRMLSSESRVAPPKEGSLPKSSQDGGGGGAGVKFLNILESGVGAHGIKEVGKRVSLCATFTAVSYQSEALSDLLGTGKGTLLHSQKYICNMGQVIEVIYGNLSGTLSDAFDSSAA